MATRIIIAGCGFGGVEAAFNLKRMLKDKVHIVAIDKTEKFDYVASLPELVSGKIKETEIAIPYPNLFKSANIDFLQTEISSIDLKNKKISTAKGLIPYDYLILALGSETAYYGIPGAKENTFELKSFTDAHRIQEHLTTLFHECKVKGKQEGDTRIVVVGGGLTGVELVTDLKDLLDKLCKDCNLGRDECELILIERSTRLNPSFSQEVSSFTEKYLLTHGIKLLLGKAVTEVRKDELLLSNGETIKAKTIVWCAGIKPSSLAEQVGEPNYDKKCGLVLNNYLQLIGNPTIYAVGDCGYCRTFEAQPILTALRAIEQADFASRNIYCDITNNKEGKFVYNSRRFPTLISLGKGMGILTFNGFWMKGRHITWMKKIVQYLYVWRYRYKLDFLEYVDELFISLIEFLYFMRIRKP